jgi:hypothetical protein
MVGEIVIHVATTHLCSSRQSTLLVTPRRPNGRAHERTPWQLSRGGNEARRCVHLFGREFGREFWHTPRPRGSCESAAVERREMAPAIVLPIIANARAPRQPHSVRGRLQNAGFFA